MIPAEEALEMGIVDALFPPEDLLTESTFKARQMGDLPARAFVAIKYNRTRETAEKIRLRLEEDIKRFLGFWY